VELTHLDASGAARMVDVSGKQVTVREATATGRFDTTAEVVELLRCDALPKGDALAVARIAAIAAAKRTPDLIPLCHPIALHAVSVDLTLTESSVNISAMVRTADRTGVEMEALTCVAVAGLALYDMVKSVDRGAVLREIRLEHKAGGRRGDWHRANQ
jgi:cyclic pyranopterin phosphate synthase